MSNEKLYFERNSDMEYSYTLKHFIEKRIESESDIFLELAKTEFHNGLYFCTEYGEVGEVGEGCGKYCSHYSPRNNKNGRCRFSKNTQTGSGKIFLLDENLKLTLYKGVVYGK